jgi:probable rRNA maturation factor
MRAQNLKYMKKNGTTDVLSFPQLAPQKSCLRYRGKFLGDILISLDQAKRQAKEQGIVFGQEVLFLTLHSILHLIGFDHGTKKELLKMQKIESEIWLDLIGVKHASYPRH